MKRFVARALLLLGLVAAAGTPAYASTTAAPRSSPPPFDAVALVDPLVGTSGNGYDGATDTFPGADAPFGMVQWSPDTPSQPAGGGYNYNDTTITGFSLTHLSGPGCSVFGDIGILPAVGPVSAPATASQAFSHASELASPGYYEITVGQPSIRTQLAVTARTGLARFTFPVPVPQATATSAPVATTGGAVLRPEAQGDLLINASSNQAGVSNAEIRIAGPSEVVGSATSGWFCGMPGTYTVYFVLDFDRPFAAHGAWIGKRLLPGADAASGAGAGAWVAFDTSAAQSVRVKASVSWVDLDGARSNLRAEANTWDVDAVRRATAAAWASELGRVRVDGGTPVQRRVFYTALYHTMLHPNVYSDADGRYRGFDGRVHRTDRGHVEYATFSGWDIYRTEMPLLALLEPQRTSDMMRSLVHAASQSGWLPKWSLVDVETAVMGGDPSDPIIAGAYAFGARDFDARAALQAMMKGATRTSGPPGQGWYYQRPGLDEYVTRGYVVDDHTTNVAPLANGASLTLEYALDDFSIAQLARAVGDRQLSAVMSARGQNWENLFDRASGTIMPRDRAGAFERAQLDEYGQHGFQEGTSAQYTWMVPQGYGALVRGMGGPRAAATALDAYFTQTDAGEDKPFAWMGNEPSIGSPWAYLAVGQPWKAQRLVRDVMTQLWGDTPDGIPGNDDLGTMSAWYVWCALGLYPQYPAAPVLDLGAPLFSHATIRAPGVTDIEISAPAASTGAAYVRGATVGGRAWSRSWVPYAPGTPLRIAMALGTTPDMRWASAAGDAPPSYAQGAPRFPDASPAWLTDLTPASITVAPGATTSFRFSVDNAGTLPESLTWSATGPDALVLTPLGGRVDAPAAATHAVYGSIAVSPRAADGLYDFSISGVADSGAQLAAITGAVRVQRPGAALRLAYVADLFDNEITAFDPRTHAVGAPILVGEFPRDVAMSPDGSRVYVADNASNDVAVVDTQTQSTIARIPVGKAPWGIRVSPDGARVWVANSSDNTVQAIDTATLAAGAPIAVGNDPEEIALSPDGKTVWVTDVGSDAITAIDGATGVASDLIPAGPRPRGIALSPDGRRLYVSDFGGNVVTPIDTATRTALAQIPVGVAPRGLAVSPDGKWLFVTDFGSNDVARIDLGTLTASRPVAVGLNPLAVAFDAAGDTAFVVDSDDNGCVPIDVKTLDVGPRIPLGDRPMGLSM